MPKIYGSTIPWDLKCHLHAWKEQHFIYIWDFNSHFFTLWKGFTSPWGINSKMNPVIDNQEDSKYSHNGGSYSADQLMLENRESFHLQAVTFWTAAS